jgi:hypothetical protein
MEVTAVKLARHGARNVRCAIVNSRGDGRNTRTARGGAITTTLTVAETQILYEAGERHVRCGQWGAYVVDVEMAEADMAVWSMVGWRGLLRQRRLLSGKRVRERTAGGLGGGYRRTNCDDIQVDAG